MLVSLSATGRCRVPCKFSVHAPCLTEVHIDSRTHTNDKAGNGEDNSVRDAKLESINNCPHCSTPCNCCKKAEVEFQVIGIET